MELSEYAAVGQVPKQGDYVTGTIYAIERTGLWISPDLPMPSDIYADASWLHCSPSEFMHVGDPLTVCVREPEDEDTGACIGSLTIPGHQLAQEMPELRQELQDEAITIRISAIAKTGDGSTSGLRGYTDTRLGLVDVYIPLSRMPAESRIESVSALIGRSFKGRVLGGGATNLLADCGPTLSITRNHEAGATMTPGEQVVGIVERAVDNGALGVVLTNGGNAYVPPHEIPDGRKYREGDKIKGTVLQLRHSPTKPDFKRWKIIVSLKSNAEWLEYSQKVRRHALIQAKVIKRLPSGGVLASPLNWPGIVGKISEVTLEPGTELTVISFDVDVNRRFLWLKIPRSY